MPTLPSPMPGSSTLSFGLELHPHARMVSVVRRFVEESFEKLVGDSDAVFWVSLAVHELLENAAKYAAGEKTALSVYFEPNGSTARTKLTNRTTTTHIARLRACIEEVQSSEEPFVLYQTIMHRSLRVDDESGLGLARIRAEGEFELSLETDGTMVTITASCMPLEREAAHE